jgi:menaquinone-dependent protoporphyrinogen oxidase
VNALIAVASKHGSTREIAQAIANELEQRGIDTDFADLSEVTDLAHHDAVILGSAVYMGRLMPEMRRFVDDHTTALLKVPVWLFGSGPIGDPPRPSEIPAELRAVADELGAHGCRWFAGRLDTAELGLKERLIVRAVKAAPGDFRPWEEIALWADEIAAALTTHAGSMIG